MRNLLTYFAILGLMASCSSYQSGSKSSPTGEQTATLKNNFTLQEQVTPPADIQSVELHPAGQKAAPPILRLHTSRQLTLEFDKLGTGNQQFTFTVSHRDKEWGKSSIVPNRYLNGFFQIHFGGGLKSFTQNPTYYHYSYRFPNRQMQITKSGNYLLSVSDFKTGTLLFRLPFFVTENKGTLKTRIETLFAQRRDARTLAQPFSRYIYPGFVRQPQFDLSFAYVQNRFWGRAQQTDFFDTATPGEVHFHLGRDQSFIGDYEFYVLNLRSFRPDGRQIINLQPGKTPPVVRLHRDVQQFKQTAPRFTGSAPGLPRNERHAQYGNIQFTLETNKSIGPGDAVYLTGDFNNWVIAPRYKMRYDSAERQWKGNALIKQGIYLYKYVSVVKGAIRDLAIDRKFTNGKQEYYSFVYFRDPQLHFDRLLKVDRTVAR